LFRHEIGVLAREDGERADLVRDLALLRERVDELARHVLTCALLLDPQRVVVGGGMSRATKVILNPLRARLESAMVFPPEVVESSFGADASLRGAVELARRAVATDHAALHVGEEA